MRKTMMVVAALVAAGSGARLEAQARFGANLSWGDDTDIALGARVGFGLGSKIAGGKLDGLVTFDYFFPNGYNYWEASGNAIYHLAKSGSVAPYVGGGLGFGHSSADYTVTVARSAMLPLVPAFNASGRLGTIGSSADRLFLNVLGGVRFKPTGNVQPFVEGRLEFGDGSQLVLTGGVFFGRK